MAPEGPSYRLLIVNPNTSTHMTEALKPIINGLNFGGKSAREIYSGAGHSKPTNDSSNIHFDYFTAPTEPTVREDGTLFKGIPSINNGEQSKLSAHHCFPHLKPLIESYDGFLVACYSRHPLVGMLRDEIKEHSAKLASSEGQTPCRRQYVTGIMDASVEMSASFASSVSLSVPQGQQRKFGIVSTADEWKEELNTAARAMLLSNGRDPDLVFAGVETTGLTAGELHSAPADVVRSRIKGAAERLRRSAGASLQVISMGCAAMAGMEEAVLEAFDASARVVVIDGTAAGVAVLLSSLLS